MLCKAAHCFPGCPALTRRGVQAGLFAETLGALPRLECERPAHGVIIAREACAVGADAQRFELTVVLTRPAVSIAEDALLQARGPGGSGAEEPADTPGSARAAARRLHCFVLRLRHACLCASIRRFPRSEAGGLHTLACVSYRVPDMSE